MAAKKHVQDKLKIGLKCFHRELSGNLGYAVVSGDPRGCKEAKGKTLTMKHHTACQLVSSVQQG